MWRCNKCGRVFKSKNKPHSCKKIPLDSHFEGKEKAKEIFDDLVDKITSSIGECKIISIPCCVHLYGKYDFLAALPKKDRLEIRFALDRELESSRLKVCVPMSSQVFKNCFDIYSKEEVDKEFMDWLRQSYHLKD